MITALSIGDYVMHDYAMHTGIGDFVRGWREERGLSQTKMETALGMARAHLAQIESGKIALPNADVRRKLATFMGVTHLQLLVAAEEITREELGTSVGIVQVDPNDPRQQLHALIDATPMSERDINTLVSILTGWSNERLHPQPQPVQSSASPQRQR